MSRPWMPLYIADYIADTGHLSAAEHGAYLLMIMHYWQKGGLPSDERQLSRIARLSPDEWADSRDTLSGFFGDGWSHARIDDELAEAREKYEKRAAAGRNGGKAKAGLKQCCSNATSNATALLKQPQPQPLNTDTSVSDAASPVDVRAELWSHGVSALQAISGKSQTQSKALVGKWLRDAQDDCALVLSKIQIAKADRIGEPVSWITAAIKPPDKPPKPLTQGESIRKMAREKGVLDATGKPTGRLAEGDRDGENPSAGNVVKLALPANLGW